ncbi:hypothetical protein [Kineosporia babensis]
MTSHAEIAAGEAAGLPMWHPFGADSIPIGLPLLLPIAIDCYVVDALERRHGLDRLAALGILALSVIGGSAYTAADSAEAYKLAGVGVVLVLVLSRLYSKPKPSKKDAEDLAVVDAAERAKAQRALDAEDARERAAAQRRIDEARSIADIAARQAEIEAAAQEQAAAASAEASRAAAEAEKAAADAEVARHEAASAAEVARVQAETEARRAERAERQSVKRPRAASTNQSAAPSKTPPSADEAARLVASAIRSHEGAEPWVFSWKEWSERHGGGRSFWFAAKAAAESKPHLAKVG